jgi:predicted metal-dependent phosphoesterase TrpH
MNTFGPVDLHCHSTASDGTLRPAEVVRLAHANGVSCLALTDHDTVAGNAEAAATAGELGMDFLPGIEVSCAFPRPGTMHLLGYGFDAAHPAMQRLVKRLAEAREERARLILRRLKLAGIELSMEEAKEQSGGGAIGRPHLAALLVQRGHVVSTNEAFRKYLGGGGAAYVDNLPLEAEQVIPLIREAGGLVSLAHPFQLRREAMTELEALVRELAEQGMEGIETMHTSHDLDAVHRLTRLADRVGLLTTGGSDFHSTTRGAVLGQVGRRPIPREFYDAVMERVEMRKSVAA